MLYWIQVNCSENNMTDKKPMTAEEKLIIEQLLADCSPTVQSIINAHNKFTIPPPCEEEESDDDDDNREEGSDELMVITQFETYIEDDGGENVSMDDQPHPSSVSISNYF